MASNVRRADHPMSMRMPEADIAIIDRAAALHGRSRTDFIRDAAVRAAEQALVGQQLVRMSADGFAHFAETIGAPPQAVPEMVALFSRKAPWSTTA